MRSSSHNDSCVCTSCTCGRHKQMCKPVVHVDTHLESETEYRKNYFEYKADPRQKGKAHPQQLKVGGEFYGTTENQEQFHPHVLPKVYQHKKEEYVPNPSKLDDITTTKSDYPAWPGVRPPEQKPRAGYVPSTAQLESMTTNKSDYKNFGVQPLYHHPPQVYVKNEAKLEGISHIKADYQNWGDYSRPPPKPKAQYVSPGEDRDFKTTATANYVTHDSTRILVKPPPQNHQSNAKFDGTTTTAVDYQQWPIPPRYARHKAEYAPSSAKIESSSVYTDSYASKMAERVESMAPKYQPINTGRFEGESTHHTDFQGYGNVARREDFKPRLKYDPKKDDRDFRTVMKLDHDCKDLPHCHAVDLIKSPLENRDGHLFVK